MNPERLELLKTAQQGDSKAIDDFVMSNTALVWSVIKRFSNRNIEMDDLFQIGCIGLIKAVKKFDPSFNVEFSTYAVPMIIGEVRRFLRDDGMIKVSRTLKEVAMKIAVTINNFQNEHSRVPSIGEISEILGIDSEEVVMALEATSRHESIYAQVANDEGAMLMIDKLTQGDLQEEKIAARVDLHNAMTKFDARSRRIIDMRYFSNKTQSETAQVLGISQVQVSRLEKKILLKLREILRQEQA